MWILRPNGPQKQGRAGERADDLQEPGTGEIQRNSFRHIWRQICGERFPLLTL